MAHRAEEENDRGTLRDDVDLVKTSIQVKAGATFLSIKARKDHVELEFQLGDAIDEFPVHRTVRISRNRVLHFAALESAGDVDKRLMGWLRKSYKLVAE